MEALADPDVANPDDLAEPEPPKREPKPLIRCHNCNVVSTLAVCVLCLSRGYVTPEVAETMELEAFVRPYDQAEETRPVPAIEFADGWRYYR